MLGDLNERVISLEEEREAVNEMKSGEAPGLDRFTVECLKKGGMAVLEWLNNSSTSFCLRSSSCRTDLSAHFQPSRPTTI